MADGEGAEGATEQTGEAGQTALTGADTTATEGAKSAESDAKTATDTGTGDGAGKTSGEGDGQGEGAGEQAKSDEGGQEAEGEGGDKDGDGQDGPPEEYADFDLPEGMAADDTKLGEFKETAKELGLTQEQAQKLVDFQASMLQQQQEQFAEQVSNWAAEAKADNEIGGKSFDDKLSLARKGLEYVGTPELREALDSTGMGNHPEVIRAFYRIGKQLGEGSFEQGRGPSSQPKTAAEVLYPSMYKEG